MLSVSAFLTVEDSRAARLSALQEVLRARFPAAAPELAPRPDGGVGTGLEALDRLLPRGGLPRGQVTEWVVARSGGSATLLRRLVLHWARPDEKVALVDAGRTLAAADWVVARSTALTFVRPPEPGDGPWCAELLLRVGGFSLVVLDGVELRSRAAQRLSHLARESDSALLVIRPTWAPGHGGRGGLATVRLQLAPASPTLTGPGKTPPGRATVTAALIKGGSPAQVEVSRETVPTHWLCVHPLVPDRRGGAARGRSW